MGQAGPGTHAPAGSWGRPLGAAVAMLLLGLLSSGCVALQGFQRAHSLPAGTFQLQTSVGGEGGAIPGYVPEHSVRPDFTLGARYGLTSSLDLLARLGFVDAEVGGVLTLTPQESDLAVATMLTVGMYPVADAGVLVGWRVGPDELTLGLHASAAPSSDDASPFLFGVGGTLSYSADLGDFIIVPEVSVLHALGRPYTWADIGGSGRLQTVLHAGLGFQFGGP